MTAKQHQSSIMYDSTVVVRRHLLFDACIVVYGAHAHRRDSIANFKQKKKKSVYCSWCVVAGQ